MSCHLCCRGQSGYPHNASSIRTKSQWVSKNFLCSTFELITVAFLPRASCMAGEIYEGRLWSSCAQLSCFMRLCYRTATPDLCRIRSYSYDHPSFTTGRCVNMHFPHPLWVFRIRPFNERVKRSTFSRNASLRSQPFTFTCPPSSGVFSRKFPAHRARYDRIVVVVLCELFLATAYFIGGETHRGHTIPFRFLIIKMGVLHPVVSGIA